MATETKTDEGIDLTGAGKGEEPKKEPKPRGRPTKVATTRDLKSRITETISGLGSYLGDPLIAPDGTLVREALDEELGEILKQDADKMAAWFAHHAEKRQRLAKALTRVFGEGSVLDFGRAFGRLLRALQARAGNVLPRPQVIHADEEPGAEEEPIEHQP